MIALAASGQSLVLPQLQEVEVKGAEVRCIPRAGLRGHCERWVLKDRGERFLGEVAAGEESFCSIKRAPASRTAEASLGKIPTTSLLRPTSRLTHSRGLVKQSGRYTGAWVRSRRICQLAQCSNPRHDSRGAGFLVSPKMGPGGEFHRDLLDTQVSRIWKI